MKPEDMDKRVKPLTSLYSHLELNLLYMIAEHLEKDIDSYTDKHVDVWYTEKMRDLNLVSEKAVKEMKKMNKQARVLYLNTLFSTAKDTLNDIDRDLTDLGKRPNNDGFRLLDEKMQVLMKRINKDINTNINRPVIIKNKKTNTVIGAYKDIADKAVARVLAGQDTLPDAIRQTTYEWTRNGLNSGFKDKRGREWSLEGYAEVVVRTAVNDVYNDIRTERLFEQDLEFMRVSSLSSARDACSKIQGKVVSMKKKSSDSKYPSIYDYGYGEPGGTRGINCRHQLFPFIPGVNTNTEPQIDPESARNKQDDIQHQRYLERRIRAIKKELVVAEKLNDEERIRKLNKRLSEAQRTIREYCKEKNLPRMNHREQI